MDTVVRTISDSQEEAPKVSNFKENKVGAEENIDDIELVEDTDRFILDSLGVDDQVRNLPDEDKDYLSEVSAYLKDSLKKDGVTPTKGALQRAFDKFKESIGLDPDTEPSVAIKKMGGLMKSWKSISFIKDLDERKKLFSKLSQVDSVEKMDQMIFEEMNKKHIWE